MSSAEHTITIPISLQPGRHDFAYSAKLRLVRGSSTLEPWSREIAFKRTVEVVPEDYPPTVTLCTDDAVGRRLHELLTVESRLTIVSGHLANGVLDKSKYLGIDIAAREALPVSMGSDVFVSTEDQEYKIGTLFALEGTTEVRVDMQRRLDFLEETDVVVALRLNAQQARAVSHDYALWGKELVLGKVKVGRIAD